MRYFLSHCLVLVICTGLSIAYSFSQVVRGHADISVCDVPGTNQVVVTGGHIVSEDQAPTGHTHASIVVQGGISRYTIAASCEQDFGATTIATCADSTSQVNGSVACTTTGTGPCSNSYRTKTIPKHNPVGGATNSGTDFSGCVMSDCQPDNGCSPFTGICY